MFSGSGYRSPPFSIHQLFTRKHDEWRKSNGQVSNDSTLILHNVTKNVVLNVVCFALGDCSSGIYIFKLDALFIEYRVLYGFKLFGVLTVDVSPSAEIYINPIGSLVKQDRQFSQRHCVAQERNGKERLHCVL